MENLDTSNWASKNLDVDHFRNGDVIEEAKTMKDWQIACENKIPAWCYFDNDPENGKKYGKLYNFYAVKDRRRLAPKGYHIPTVEEWTDFGNLIEKEAGKKLESKTGLEGSGNLEDQIGFNTLPGGYRIDDGSFDIVRIFAEFWSATEIDYYMAAGFTLDIEDREVYIASLFKSVGAYVRCVKD